MTVKAGIVDRVMLLPSSVVTEWSSERLWHAVHFCLVILLYFALVSWTWTDFLIIATRHHGVCLYGLFLSTYVLRFIRRTPRLEKYLGYRLVQFRYNFGFEALQELGIASRAGSVE
jgi:hypothetical protein